ncbi:MAG: DsbA family protein [Pseudomonadota bacterium]
MGIRAAVKNRVARSLFSIERRNANRVKAERKRLSSGASHIVEYFHEVGDPYSHLMVQVLPEFCRRYEVELKVYLVPPPPDWAAPDRERLETYSRLDSARLGKRAGLRFTDPGKQPSPDQIRLANAKLMAAIDQGTFLEAAEQFGDQLWQGTLTEEGASSSDIETALKANGAHRDELGHYLGATLYYAGEWYWGPDRLHYLEQRLRELSATTSHSSEALIYPPADAPSGNTGRIPGAAPELHWYLSLRSPYTAIVGDRVKALAEAYGATLKLRYVLPMVMRGMKVPRKKGFYIMSDVVREAERQGTPFGNAVDPVGEPVERGCAILEAAIQRGKGFEFAKSFLTGVWADGLDAGTDRGLKKITERVGLSWAEMKPLIGTDGWRPVAEANREEMFKYEIWGVPSFRVGEVAVWGQDRLWVIEDALKAMVES